MQNPYELLGLSQTATESEIRLRFRELIATAASDTVRFEALKAAFDTLKDPDSRHLVDVRLAAEAAADNSVPLTVRRSLNANDEPFFGFATRPDADEAVAGNRLLVLLR